MTRVGAPVGKPVTLKDYVVAAMICEMIEPNITIDEKKNMKMLQLSRRAIRLCIMNPIPRMKVI